MTGRLDQVDLDTDLILLVLARAQEPLRPETVEARIREVDTEPYAFDDAFPGGTDEFCRGVALLVRVNHVEVAGDHLVLTTYGARMADVLEGALDDPQDRALEAAEVGA